MPLIYGEGAKNAFGRFQEEVDKSRRKHQLDELSTGIQAASNSTERLKTHQVTVVHDHQPKSPPSSTVPFRRDDDFINRDSLDKIRQICSKPASRAALVGLGGVGKSQIAIEYAYQVRDRTPTTWVFWVHAGTQARFKEGYRRIAEVTRMDGWDDPKADILRLVRSWLCDESNGRWVMIVDNADDLGVFFLPYNRLQTNLASSLDPLVESLSDFLPQSPNGSILITSRSRDVAFRLTGSYTDIVRVDPMDQEHALALVRNKLQGDFDPDDAAALAQALDYMPLAITQAAAYIGQRAPRATVSKYLQDLHKGDRDRANLLDTDVGDFRRDGTASNSIIATWQISFAYIRRVRPSATRLLSLMSLFDRQGIPESLLDSSYQENDDASLDFEDDLNILMSFSLVTANVGGSQFEMHRLVQFSTKRWLELNEELEEWKEKYVRLMDNSYPVGQHENWTVCQALFPHAQAVVGEAILGVEHPSTLASVDNLGSVLSRQGKYEEAEAMHQRALKGHEKVLGPEHPYTLASIDNLGSVLSRQGKYKEAEAMHQQVLKGYKKVLGPEHPDTLISVSHLGSVFSSQGKYEEAEVMHQQALNSRERVLGPEHPDTLNSVSHLGLVFSSQGRQGKYKEAEAMHQQALKTSERVLGPEHPDTLSSVSYLGSVFSIQGKYEEAEVMHQRALKTRERVLGPEHPSTFSSASRLGSVFSNQGKYEEAEAMHQRALKGYEKVLGQEHPSTLNSASHLGSVFLSQGKHEGAEAMHQRALKGYQKVLGLEHPSTLSSVSHLGLVLSSQGKYEEAEVMHWRALKSRERVLGPEHPSTLSSVSHLGSVLSSQGKYEEAEAMHQRVLKGTEKGDRERER
ncbi:hypothetical protein OIDMADRAFT_131494 [Oidiodendron maius Zn]|uniref:DUF7779 domain-containing protein n=1 Tax=Oidiodendron maius (strain Zn) TaxID=913774 RepID=A0A0C3H304_OIDMZ|nr:hypothetical protein OIDMADRAFT_131494 [Oidiodendron maius Zn]